MTKKNKEQNPKLVDLSDEQYGILIKYWRRYQEAENKYKQATANVNDLLVALAGSDFSINVDAEGNIKLYRSSD